METDSESYWQAASEEAEKLSRKVETIKQTNKQNKTKEERHEKPIEQRVRVVRAGQLSFHCE